MKEILQSDWFERILPVLKVVLVLLVGLILMKVLKRYANKLLEKTKVDKLIRDFIIHAVQIIILVLIILSVLDILGFDSSSVVTIIAACGAAVALALKDSLSNLAGGILLMFSKVFNDGDYIDVCGVEGTVQSIDLLHTNILTADGRTVVIPNGSLTTNSITNRTILGKRRLDMKIGVSYDTDIDLARYTLLSLVKSDSRVWQEPAPFCAVEEYGDSAITLVVRVWCDQKDYWNIKYDIQNRMKPALDEAKIEIPFPQMDVHIKENGNSVN